MNNFDNYKWATIKNKDSLEEQFKVGDWVYTKGNSGGWGMIPEDEYKVFQIKAIGEESGKFTLDGDSCSSTRTKGIIRVRIQDVRKALPHEIPPYNTIYDKGLVDEMVHFSQGYDQLRPKKKGFDEKEHLSKPYNQMLTVKIKKTNKTKTKQLFL